MGLKFGRTMATVGSVRGWEDKRRKTYSVGLEYVVNPVVSFSIIELGCVHGTDKRAMHKCNLYNKNQHIIRGRNPL